MSNKKIYDLIFSLGQACSCTNALREHDLQVFSYPFDWIYGSDIEGRINILLSDFKDYLNEEDFVNTGKTNLDCINLCHVYLNKSNNLIFYHDFPVNISFEESLPEIKLKYKRRINRLLSQIKNVEKVLMVYIEMPNCEDKITSNSVLIDLCNKIKKKYPDKVIDLLYFIQNSDLKHLTYKIENINSDIIKITGNYKSTNSNLPVYSVDMRFFKRFFKNYLLNLPQSYRLKKSITRLFVNLLPIKKFRLKLKKKYHIFPIN